MEFKFGSLWVEFKICPPGVLLVGVAFMGACFPVSVWGRGGTNVEEEEGGEGDLCVVEECLSRCFLEKWYTIPTPIQSPAMLTSVRNRSLEYVTEKESMFTFTITVHANCYVTSKNIYTM